MPFGFDNCTLAGFSIMLISFVVEFYMLKVFKPEYERLLPHNQADFYENQSRIFKIKQAVSILFIIACFIDLYWQFKIRTDDTLKYSNNTMVYFS
jgi:hypothetical protein